MSGGSGGSGEAGTRNAQHDLALSLETLLPVVTSISSKAFTSRYVG